MVPLQMELGGKDACIICEDADLELAAQHIVKGGFSYSGQRCTAVKLVFAPHSVADRLVAMVNERVAKLTVGRPEDDADITPVISKSSADFIQGLVEDARDKGAVLCQEWSREGNLIRPMVVDKVTRDMRLAWEEPFGPVLPIVRVGSVDEAVAHCNENRLALQGCVFTRDVNQVPPLQRLSVPFLACLWPHYTHDAPCTPIPSLGLWPRWYPPWALAILPCHLARLPRLQERRWCVAAGDQDLGRHGDWHRPGQRRPCPRPRPLPVPGFQGLWHRVPGHPQLDRGHDQDQVHGHQPRQPLFHHGLRPPASPGRPPLFLSCQIQSPCDCKVRKGSKAPSEDGMRDTYASQRRVDMCHTLCA